MDDVKERPQPIDVVQLARQRAGEVKAKTIHVQLGHPVPQAVHDQLQDVRAQHVERVATAGEVGVVATLVVCEPIVRGVVDPAQGEGRPQMIAFARVVVDHVQDHLQPRAVEPPDHLLELPHGARRRGGITRVGRKIGQRVVTPVVRQPPFDQMAIVHPVMDRQQLHGRHAQPPQMLQHRT